MNLGRINEALGKESEEGQRKGGYWLSGTKREGNRVGQGGGKRGTSDARRLAGAKINRENPDMANEIVPTGTHLKNALNRWSTETSKEAGGLGKRNGEEG